MYIIFYDIANSKRLHKTARVLEDYGTRVQQSVFYCDVTESELKKIISRLQDVVDCDEDSVMIQPVCASCVQKTSFIGQKRAVQITALSEKFQIV